MIGEPMHVTLKEWNSTMCQLYQLSSEKWGIHYTLSSAIVTNQQLFEKHLCIQSVHNEKYKQFPLCYHKINTFRCQERINGIQGKTLVEWIAVCVKAPLGPKQLWTAKTIKPNALAIVKLHEGIS